MGERGDQKGARRAAIARLGQVRRVRRTGDDRPRDRTRRRERPSKRGLPRSPRRRAVRGEGDSVAGAQSVSERRPRLLSRPDGREFAHAATVGSKARCLQHTPQCRLQGNRKRRRELCPLSSIQRGASSRIHKAERTRIKLAPCAGAVVSMRSEDQEAEYGYEPRVFPARLLGMPQRAASSFAARI